MRKVIVVAALVAMVLLATSVAYAENIEGGPGNDRIVGTDNRDRLMGYGGADDISGLGGPDSLFGGFGKDYLVAGGGEDRIEAGAGDDVIKTGGGSEGDGFSDEASCGRGHDVVWLSRQDHAIHNFTGDQCEEIRHY